MKAKSTDMTKGSVTKAIIAFALPILLGNLFQQAYNVADTAIAGHLLGDDALSAIGATGPLFNILMQFIGGMNGGFTLVIARFFGENNKEKLIKCISTMVVFNGIITLIAVLFALTFIKSTLNLIHIPEEIFDSSYKYIIVVFLGSGITACYNAQSGFLRACGNSVTPIVFSVIANIVNIILDVVFIAGFHMGVMGASLATVISQAVSVALCFIPLHKGYKAYRVTKAHFRYDKEIYSEMFYAGTTMAMMNCIFALGSLILQGAINGLGKTIIAGHLAARKIAEIFMQPMITIGTACSTFVSQNFGAKKYDRIKKAIKSSIMIELAMASIFIIIVYALAVPMINLVTDTSNPLIVETAKKYLYINLPFYFFLGMLYVLRTSIQSIGKRVPPLISSSIELASKCISAFVFTGIFGYLGVCVAEPISWVLGVLFLVYSFTKAYKSLSCDISKQQRNTKEQIQ